MLKWYLLYSKYAFYEANLLLQRKETKFLVTKPTFEKLSLKRKIEESVNLFLFDNSIKSFYGFFYGIVTFQFTGIEDNR